MDRQTDDPIHRAEFPAALVRSGRGEIGAARAVLGSREYPRRGAAPCGATNILKPSEPIDFNAPTRRARVWCGPCQSGKSPCSTGPISLSNRRHETHARTRRTHRHLVFHRRFAGQARRRLCLHLRRQDARRLARQREVRAQRSSVLAPRWFAKPQLFPATTQRACAYAYRQSGVGLHVA